MLAIHMSYEKLVEISCVFPYLIQLKQVDRFNVCHLLLQIDGTMG